VGPAIPTEARATGAYNYFIYPVARADGVDVPSEWTLRYTDEPAAVQAVVRRSGE